MDNSILARSRILVEVDVDRSEDASTGVFVEIRVLKDGGDRRGDGFRFLARRDEMLQSREGRLSLETWGLWDDGGRSEMRVGDRASVDGDLEREIEVRRISTKSIQVSTDPSSARRIAHSSICFEMLIVEDRGKDPRTQGPVRLTTHSTIVLSFGSGRFGSSTLTTANARDVRSVLESERRSAYS